MGLQVASERAIVKAVERMITRGPLGRAQMNLKMAQTSDPLYSHLPRFRTTAGAKLFFSDLLLETLSESLQRVVKHDSASVALVPCAIGDAGISQSRPALRS